MQHDDNVTTAEIRKALEGLDDVYDSYKEWTKYIFKGANAWYYLRYWPRDGEWTVGAEGSACYPAAEWEGKDPLAPVTVLGQSNTGCQLYPGDGYEWDFVTDGEGKEKPEYAVNAANCAEWCPYEDYDPADEHKSWKEVEFFNVSTRQVDPDYTEIDQKVNELREKYTALLKGEDQP